MHAEDPLDGEGPASLLPPVVHDHDYMRMHLKARTRDRLQKDRKRVEEVQQSSDLLFKLRKAEDKSLQ